MLRTLALVVLCALVAGACRRAAPGPAGGPVRIVALSPALAIMLRDLGVADRIVGRHGFDMVLDKSVPVCGDQAGIDYEALVRARPTHIVLEWGSARALPERLSRLAEENGWEVSNYTLLTLDELVAAASDLRRRFAPHGPDLAAEMDEAWRRREGVFSGRTLLLLSADPPAALGPGSFHQDILERIGGVAAISEGRPYVTLDAEDVLRLAPEAIILIVPRSPGAPERGGEASADEVRAMLGRVGRLEVPAVRDGRLALIDDPLALTPSSAMIGFAERLARVLEEWGR